MRMLAPLLLLMLPIMALATESSKEEADLFSRSQTHLAKFHSKILAETNSTSDKVVIKKSAIRKNESKKEKASAN